MEKKRIVVTIYNGWINVSVWSVRLRDDDVDISCEELEAIYGDEELVEEYYARIDYVHIRYKPSRSVTIFSPSNPLKALSYEEDRDTCIEVENPT